MGDTASAIGHRNSSPFGLWCDQLLYVNVAFFCIKKLQLLYILGWRLIRWRRTQNLSMQYKP